MLFQRTFTYPTTLEGMHPCSVCGAPIGQARQQAAILGQPTPSHRLLFRRTLRLSASAAAVESPFTSAVALADQ